MGKIQFDLRQSILDLITQLQRERLLDGPESPVLIFQNISRRCIVDVPEEIVSAIRGQIDTD